MLCVTNGLTGQYLHNAADHSLPALLDKAQGSDIIQNILQVAPRARVCVNATDSHIALSIHVTKLHLYKTIPMLHVRWESRKLDLG